MKETTKSSIINKTLVVIFCLFITMISSFSGRLKSKRSAQWREKYIFKGKSLKKDFSNRPWIIGDLRPDVRREGLSLENGVQVSIPVTTINQVNHCHRRPTLDLLSSNN